MRECLVLNLVPPDKGKMLFTCLGRPAQLTRSLARSASSILAVAPSSSRHLALPLAFLTVKGWDSHGTQCALLEHYLEKRILTLLCLLDSHRGWEDWISRFAARGYSSLLLQVDPAAAPSTSLDGLESGESCAEARTPDGRADPVLAELVRLLRDPSASSPFPPLLFASSGSSLLAEQYVSSHPLSGLCLVDPVNPSSAHKFFPHFFSKPLDGFNYEPGFPIAVVESGSKQADEEHWLLKDFGPQEGEDEEDALVRRLRGERDEGGWQKMMDWMDENSL